MLQAMRKGIGNLLAKVILVLLVVSFGAWGIADYITGGGPNSGNIVAKVEGQAITITQLASAYQRDLRQNRLDQLAPEALRALRLADISLEGLIDQKIWQIKAEDEGLIVPDEWLKTALASDARFLDQSGAFDPAKFRIALMGSGGDEASFLNQLRQEASTNMLRDTLNIAIDPPDQLTNDLYQWLTQQRSGAYIELSGQSLTIETPDDTKLQSFYDENKEQFRQPTTRDIAFLWVDPEAVAQSQDITDDELKASYNSQRASLVTPEKRQITQILVPGSDEGAMDKLQQALNALPSATLKDEKALETAVTAIDLGEGITPRISDLGWLSRDDFPDPKLAEAAFDPAEPGFTGAIEGPFGTVILYVEAIQFESTPAFEDVADQLRADLAQQQAAQEIPALIAMMEEESGRGKSLGEIAQITGLFLHEARIDATGRDLEGNALSLPGGEFLNDSFSLMVGEIGFVQILLDGGYLIQVRGETPSQIPPLSQIKDKVISAWQAQQRETRLNDQAEALKADIESGASIESLAAAQGLKLTKINRINRQGESKADTQSSGATGLLAQAAAPKTNPQIAEALFNLPATGNQAVVISPAPDSFVVIARGQVFTADHNEETALRQNLQTLLATSFSEDLIGLTLQSWKQDMDIERFPDVVGRLYGE